MEKRLKLKSLRAGRDLSQDEMAEKLEVSRGTYADIENGTRDGSVEFWLNLAKLFELSDSEVVELMKNEPEAETDASQ